MSTATYRVQVSWTTGPMDAPVWADLTGDVKQASITRGRPSDLASMQQGACSLRLKDGDGKYNPQNPASPLAPNLEPMKQVIVQATYGGTTHTLFRGFVSRLEYNPDPGVQETALEAVDLFEFLNSGKPVIGVQASQRIDQLIGAILDALGWTASVQARNLQTSSHVVPSWSADGTKSALQLIQDLLTVDLGMFFIAGDGRPTYFPTSILYANAPAVATLTGSQVGGMRGSTDVKNILNGQVVTRTGGVGQSASDAASQAKYGHRDGPPIKSANLKDDNQASALANFVVLLGKQPRTPARDLLLINRDDVTLTQQLSRELGDVMTVSVSAGGTVFTGPIQSLAHQITSGGLVHQTTFTVQAATIKGFTIGVSTIGGPDVLTY